MKELPFKISESKKKIGKYCCAYACTNEPIYRKGGLCHKHNHRKNKAIDPVAVRYNNWKQSAIQRKKHFAFTLEQFRELCQQTGYIITKGRRGKAVSIDRIDNSLGYVPGNINLMTLRANINKYHEVDKIDCPF